VKALGLALGMLLCFFPARAHAEDETFGLSISVARQDGKPVREDAWIREQIASANELFAPSGTRFRWVHDKALPERHAELHSRADRDALAAFTEPRGYVDIFVVAVLEDVDEPGRLRKGVAWTQKPDGRRYLVVAAGAPPQVLAHELGHFFGNAHTTVPDNLMSYERTGGTVSFDDSQSARIRSFSRRFLDTGRLYDVGPPRFFLWR
jgi:Metallo-peptidase family M12B Reprolysin-like